MLENLKECNDEKMELNLELSIGGNYGISTTYVSYDKNDVRQEIGNGILDVNKKREDKLFFDALKFQLRVQDRENRENEIDLGRKGEKNGKDMNLSLFSHNIPSENVKIEKEDWSSNGYLERSVSDYQGKFYKGASSSDAGSHSSGLSSQQEKTHPMTYHLFEQLEDNDSSSSTESRKVTQLSEDSSRTKNKRSTYADPTSRQTNERSNAVTKKRPPRPSNLNQATPHMPCVSTKGNGPNGKTIMGFLYKYTKSETSIMCVCHGTSFSPAGFVEHAGCVDIENPLRHITVVSSA